MTDAFMKYGVLGAGGPVMLTGEENEILCRFATEFERTYTRFLDLQKAELQARESQIEASLERLRARTMAMQKASELREASQIFATQLHELGFTQEGVYFALLDEDAGTMELWSVDSRIGSTSEVKASSLHVFPLDLDDPDAAGWFNAWKERVHTRPTFIAPEDMDAWYGAYKPAYDDIGQTRQDVFASYPDGVHLSDAFMRFGILGAMAARPFSEEENNILYRFAVEFERTYTRFLDLQKAELQARESNIEASLERVRGKAMAMQAPEDIGDVSILMFDELERLGITSLRSGISIPLDDDRYEFRAATKTSDGESTLVLGNESTDVHAVIRRAFDGWKRQEPFQKIVLEGEELLDYYHAVFDTMPLPDWQDRMKTGSEAREEFATFPFADGWLYTFSRNEIGDEQISILVRVAKVFGLAYQRYHDLTKAELDYQALLAEKAKTEQALTNLQATQKQLIESEKLASLGALTAGIAHEIKNPLNFVNNFAEVSEEMVEEAKEALEAGNTDEASTILSEIAQNATQIAKHGKRADSIVKSMMQHARGGSSEAETVDINTYLEEYIGLAWHGMRARNDDFQADVIRDFADDAGSLSVQPQELGRVILNLLNNAFDAVKHEENGQVTVTSARNDNNVTITLSDNGPGIPEDIRKKIFEPFFTTKATGEGTGLGLSLSYDIITKGHGGTLRVGSAKNGGAAFTLTLPGTK
jgi:signal transduction histidine kinase